MNLKQLEVFYAIMVTGSITAAARSLNAALIAQVRAETAQKIFNVVGGNT
jgi:DNA-binding transcriptional LysR family regulator